MYRDPNGDYPRFPPAPAQWTMGMFFRGERMTHKRAPHIDAERAKYGLVTVKRSKVPRTPRLSRRQRRKLRR